MAFPFEVFVSVHAGWEDGALEAVFVELRGRGRDRDGEPRWDAAVLTFTESASQTWSPRGIDVQHEYQFRHRVLVAGRGIGEPTEWAPLEGGGAVVVVVERPPRLNVVVHTVNPIFEFVTHTEVVLAYEDEEAGIAREEATLILDAAHPSREYTRLLPAPVRRPYHYRVRHRLPSGRMLNGGPWRESTSTALVVHFPFASVLRVRLVIAPDAEVFAIELAYEDPEGDYEAQAALLVDGRVVTWRLPLLDPERREYRYRVWRTDERGALVAGDWIRTRDATHFLGRPETALAPAGPDSEREEDSQHD